LFFAKKLCKFSHNIFEGTPLDHFSNRKVVKRAEQNVSIK
jgi:hypothetical protein